jgi:hypothetical protein
VRKTKFLAVMDLELSASGLRLLEHQWYTLKTIGDLADQQIIDGLVMFSADGMSNLQEAINLSAKALARACCQTAVHALHDASCAAHSQVH